MESKSSSIKVSTFLKYGLTEVDVRLGSKYASVNIALQGFT